MARRKRDSLDAAGFRTQSPPAIQERHGKFWPKDRAHPTAYIRPMYIPCPKCDRVRMDDGGRAVALRATSGEIAYFRCKDCGHQFKMPMQDAENILDPKTETE